MDDCRIRFPLGRQGEKLQRLSVLPGLAGDNSQAVERLGVPRFHLQNTFIQCRCRLKVTTLMATTPAIASGISARIATTTVTIVIGIGTIGTTVTGTIGMTAITATPGMIARTTATATAGRPATATARRAIPPRLRHARQSRATA